MRFLFSWLVCCYAAAGWAQAPLTPPDSSKRLEILKADRYNFEKQDSVNRFLSLAGNVVLRQQGTLFYADSAVLNQQTNVVEAFGNIHINDGDTLHTHSRYLRYKGNEKLAYLKEQVQLRDNKGSVLTTSELNYDMNIGIAEYTKGGKVVNRKTTLTSKRGKYYDATRDVVFSNEVVLIDPENKMYTDSLQYNAKNEIATFIAPTRIINGKRKIFTRSGFYDLKNRKAVFADRPSIVDSTYTIDANDMAFDDKAGLAQFKGNVVYIDTANGVSVLSDQLFANKNTSSFLATEKPLLILTQDQDSVFIVADTLFSGKISEQKNKYIPWLTDTTAKGWKAPDLTGKDSSMNRFFEAWHHVRIFSDSVQAVADSLFYAGTDSAFRLFGNPIVWSSDSQITADTMYLFTKNKKAEQLRAFYNGFIINRTKEGAFNQVKGNTINAWFKEGNIDFVRVKGRAESVYYAQDENERYVGLNRASADAIDMFFENKKARKIKFINDLKGATYPVSQVPPDTDRLRGFSWQEDKRPKSKIALLGRL